MVACTERLTLDCTQWLAMGEWMSVSACVFESVCVCVCILPCHLAGLSPTDLVPLSRDIIRAVFSLGQIVLSETQIV